MVGSKHMSRYLFVILLVLVAYLSYLVVHPFVNAILTSAVLAYIFYPVYGMINKKLKSRNLSAFIASVIIILIIAAPFFLLLGSLADESQFVYIRAKQIFTTGDVFGMGCPSDANNTVCTVSNKIGEFLKTPSVRYHLEESITKMTSSISKTASDIVFSIPTILLNIFVTFFATFYLFRDGPGIIERVKKLLPLKLHHQKQMLLQLDETMYAIIYGSLLVSVIQGAVGALGFFIFGVSSPITWGILMAIFALIPFIGTAIIWLPVSAVMILQGFSTGSQAGVLMGVGLLVYCGIIVSSIDNLLKPYIIGKKASIHPLLVLLGVLGGISVFGFIGFIIGPLMLALLITLVDIYEKEKLSGDGLE